MQRFARPWLRMAGYIAPSGLMTPAMTKPVAVHAGLSIFGTICAKTTDQS